MWPFKKKAVEQPRVTKKGVEGFPDDWEPKQGKWAKVERCHCGQNRKWSVVCFDYSDSGLYDVCPKCGHEDKWSTFVARDTWEESPSRNLALQEIYESGKRWDEWHRNQGIERWTPDHCKVEEPNG